VVALVDATELNGLGGEWKTLVKVGDPLEFETRFYQPVNYQGHLFLSPFGGWRQELADVFVEEVDVGTYQVSRAAVGFDIGYDFGTVAELRVGYLRAWGKGRRKVGDPVFPNLDWDEGGLHTRLVVDQIDNVNLPHSGYFGLIEYLGNRTSLGGSESYDRFEGNALGVRTLGRWTGLLKIEGGSGLGDDVPFYDEFRLGGLFNLSGRPIGQLTGDKYALAAGLLYYRLTDKGGAILKNLSVGVSIEGGNTYEFQQPITFGNLKAAGSIYVVADTLIGPFFVGYGRSGSGNEAAYMFLNRSFR
jgi:NTE family protein